MSDEVLAPHRFRIGGMDYVGYEEALRAIAKAREEEREKLGKWLRHDGMCGIVGGYGYCTCGLDEARGDHVKEKG